MEYKFIRVANYRQACAYVKFGLQPVKLEYDEEINRMVYIFKTEDTKEAWELWKHYKIKL